MISVYAVRSKRNQLSTNAPLERLLLFKSRCIPGADFFYSKAKRFAVVVYHKLVLVEETTCGEGKRVKTGVFRFISS